MELILHFTLLPCGVVQVTWCYGFITGIMIEVAIPFASHQQRIKLPFIQFATHALLSLSHFNLCSVCIHNDLYYSYWWRNFVCSACCSQPQNGTTIPILPQSNTWCFIRICDLTCRTNANSQNSRRIAKWYICYYVVRHSCMYAIVHAYLNYSYDIFLNM